MFRLSSLFLCAWLPLCVAAAEPEPDPAPDKVKTDSPDAPTPDMERMKALFTKLGHEDFEEREKAMVELIDMGPGIRDELVKLEKETKDAEVAHRCATIRESLAGVEQTALGVLQYIEKSGGTFFRHGGRRTNFDGPKFAAHLRAKAVLGRFSLTGSAKEFIQKVATTSSLHGTAYRVLLPDGTELDVKEWLGKKYRLE